MGALAALALLLAPALAGTLRVDMLDVGQGDAILITSPAGKRVLIDAGPDRDEAADQLQRIGVDHLDLAVATHPHADHIGGMQAVLERIPTGIYLDSAQAHTSATYTALMDEVEAEVEAGELRYQAALSGQVFNLDDGITLRVLWPQETKLRNTRSDLNSNSVVIRLDHGQSCFLFTGDAEEPTERALLRDELTAGCDVLKVAHHGSRHSTTDSFLRAVDPEIALISCGVDNRYGHPGQETVDKLRQAGVAIYRTDETGHITVQSDGSTLAVTDGLPSEGTGGKIPTWLGVEAPITTH